LGAGPPPCPDYVRAAPLRGATRGGGALRSRVHDVVMDDGVRAPPGIPDDRWSVGLRDRVNPGRVNPGRGKPDLRMTYLGQSCRSVSGEPVVSDVGTPPH